MILQFFASPPSPIWNTLLPLIGVILGAGISVFANIWINSANQRTKLFELVSARRFEAAAKLMTEAEYLRRGLTEYTQQHSDSDKNDFKERWKKTARELSFYAFTSGLTLNEEVEKAALSLEIICRLNMDSANPSSEDVAVMAAYNTLQQSLREQIHLPEMINSKKQKKTESKSNNADK